MRGKGKFQSQFLSLGVARFMLASALLATPTLLQAKPEDADSSEERMRSSFIDQFTLFTQDKNVQGKVRRPDGKTASGGKKTRFNEDDGLPFQSDLTYHDFSFNSSEKQETGKKDAQGKPITEEKKLFAFVSSHGGVSAAGGSSVLERTAYSLDKKFEEQDKKNKDKKEEEGIRYESIFKITTKEIFDKDKDANASSNSQNGQQEEEPDKVERVEARDEAKKEFDKVGTQSADTIIEAAKGAENAKDPEQLGNGVLLRQAAADATLALYKSTLTNLIQGRLNRAIRQGNLPVGVQVSEGVPNCDKWAGVVQDVLNQAPPERKEELSKEVQRMVKQCKEVAALPYSAVNPEFEKDDNGQNESLKIKGPQKEDAYQRDLRNQLEIMAKAGKSVRDLPSNWEYTEQDDKARMTISYDDNQPKEGSLTVEQQLESYNKNLEEAEKGYKEVKSRLTDLKVPKVTDYAITPGKQSMMEINQPPASAFEEVGMEAPEVTAPPQTYDEVLKVN